MKLTRKKAERSLLRSYTLNAVKHEKLYPLSMHDVNIYYFSSNKSCSNAKMGKLLLVLKSPCSLSLNRIASLGSFL